MRAVPIAGGLLPIPPGLAAKVMRVGELSIPGVPVFILTTSGPLLQVGLLAPKTSSWPVRNAIYQRVLPMCSYLRLVNTIYSVLRQYHRHYYKRSVTWAAIYIVNTRGTIDICIQ